MGSEMCIRDRYHVTPEKGQFGVALANIGEALPSEFSAAAILNGQGGGNGYWSNAFVIVDYQDNENFKFAGSFIGGNIWTIGEVIDGTIHRRAEHLETVNTGTDYHVKADVLGKTLTLLVDGTAKKSYTFSDPLHDGKVGIGTINARASFDDIVIKAATPMPEAKKDYSQTTSGQSIVIDVLANDVPVDGTTIAIKSVAAGEGDVVIEDGKLTYTPADGFRGTDTFSYTIEDSLSLIHI